MSMYKQSKKQQFVKSLINNAGYYNKQIATKNVIDFLKQNRQFNPRQAIRRNANDQISSFVQITNFVQLGNILTQMYIGVPINYPTSPPFFLISVNRDHMRINDQQKLLQRQLISNQKDQKGQNFIRLKFPIIDKQWNPNNLTLTAAFNALMLIISNPPILSQLQDNRAINFPPRKPDSRPAYNASNNASKSISKSQQRIEQKKINELKSSLYNDTTYLLDCKQKLQATNNSIDCHKSRFLFLSQHLPLLRSKLLTFRNTFETQLQQLEKVVKQIQTTGNCDKLIQISQYQMDKLNALSQQQVLKQAQAKFRSKLEKDHKIKFSQSKKMMKLLFDRMFDNQTKLLKITQ